MNKLPDEVRATLQDFPVGPKRRAERRRLRIEHGLPVQELKEDE